MTNIIEFDMQNATGEDVPLIRRLLNQKGSKFMGPSKRNILDARLFLEQYATHRILVREKAGDENIIGFAEFKNYPRIFAMNMNAWTDWLDHLFCVKCIQSSAQNAISVSNTLYMTYFVYDPTYFPNLFCMVYREVFFRERKLRYIVGLQRPFFPQKYIEDEPCYDIFHYFGKTYYPKVYSLTKCRNTQKLYVIHRNDIITKMRYRKALPEDNDEIVEVVDVELPNLKQNFGDYYIAEELLNNDPHKTFVITEINHITVGFFWLNDNVNIMKLIRNFELERYGNLLKVSLEDSARVSVVHVTEIDRKNPALLFTSAAISEVLDGRKSIALKIDQDDWSSYASLNTYIEKDTVPQSSINYVNFGSLKHCYQRMQDLVNCLKSTSYYFHHKAKLMRVFYKLNTPTQSNVFAIQLVGLRATCDIREVFRFLMASFSSCEDRDYCIFSMPAQWEMTPTVHELLKYFIPVLPRPGREFDDTLYITHRSCLCGDIIIQTLKKADVEYIQRLLYEKDMKPPTSEVSMQTELPEEEDPIELLNKTETETVLEIMDEVLNNPWSNYKFFTIRVGNSDKLLDGSVIIGFVILRQFQHIRSLRHHFHLPTTTESLSLTHAEVVVLRLHPNFCFESDFIFREISRLSGYLDFYYFSPTKFQRRVKKPFTNDLVTRMQPIEPKRTKKRKHSHLCTETANCSSGESIVQLSFEDDRFAAYVNRLLPSKLFGSLKAIVIVGFNALCKAYLRLKIFEWNTMDHLNQKKYCCLPWHNITVITKPGVAEAELDLHFKCDTCVEQELCWINWQNYDSFVRDATLRMDLTKYAKFVNGKMRAINREKKVITMENDCEIFYDELVLLAETEHGLPQDKSPKNEWPTNYQHINNRLDKILMYHKLKVLQSTHCEDCKIKYLVYGKHLRTFEFINFLITHGVAGKHITLVLYIGAPLDLELKPNNPYHDMKIELILQEMVEDLGVKVYENYVFSHWIMSEEENNTIKSAVFDCPYRKALTLDCHMFISYYETNLDFRYMQIISDAEIQMKDGNIMIDYSLRTNDPSIYAAGKSTQPYTVVKNQYNFVDSKELASKLITVMSEDFDEATFNSNYNESSYCATQLPLDYYMVKIIMPKQNMDTHLPEEDSYSLTTYHDFEFCRVRLNRMDVVEEIVCITKKVISMDFLKHFCGKHELMLNNLKSRHYLHYFDSFLEFFRQPWSELIQHELFPGLQEQNRDLIVAKAQTILFYHKNLDRKLRQQLLHKMLDDLGTKSQIEANLLHFLRRHRDDFHYPFALPEDYLRTHDIFR